ncbi:PLC-like phosphodiesterase [Aulographum hederae CBS 113979]|uniref:PLC-like phosphodiesterase n=1 Tax=Aulographum hederae CBS 113979 TaxID=1176131 RepID=A0A6G1GVH2_9PEZI|nr:PLC-like phosphodiesterase [Aulographum hederae CBS 113979]
MFKNLTSPFTFPPKQQQKDKPRMTAPPLTIRNLTATPLDLMLIERYEAPGSQEVKSLGNFTSNLTSFVSNTTGINVPGSGGPSSKALAENAQSFAHQNVRVRVEPFKTVKTDIKASERAPNEILRMTIECSGQRYRIDTPSPQHSSSTFTPLVQNPSHHFTGVFLPSSTHLSVFSSANLDSWMRNLKDSTPLSALSIPGTHNAPTHHMALPSVRCQAVSPAEQLANGIRFFDVRVQPPSAPSTDSALQLVHGVFPISLTGPKYLPALLTTITDFLHSHPSETLILSLKREGAGQHTDQQLSRILKEHHVTDAAKWWTEPRIPRLGEARGKIVLLRRFALDDALKREHGGRGWAIDAENWAYNTPNDTHGDVCVQDFCEVLETENIDKKIQYSREHMARAGDCVCDLNAQGDNAPRQPLYLNFLSASNFWKVGCWPDKIAAKVNPAVIAYLASEFHSRDGQKGDGTTGVVVCDWVGEGGDWDLVRCIVGMNSKLELREKNEGR